MREGWQTKILDDLCEIARGGSPRPIKQYLTDAIDGVNWIKISDATASSKYIYRTKEKIRPEGVIRSRLVHEGDFLLSNSMSFGRPYIMKTSGCIHDGWLVLSDKSGLFDQDYLYYFLGSNAAYRQFDERAAGSTVRNLNIDLVRSVEVPLPPLPEQKRIVAILDEAFEGIGRAVANAERNLANARELFDSYLNAIFNQKGEGWVQTTLGDIAAFKNGLNFTKRSKGERIKIVGVKDFKSNYWVPMEELESVQIEGLLSNAYALRKDDILTVRSNGNKQLIGRCILADNVPEKTSHSGFTIRIRIRSSDVDSAYLVYYLKSGAVRERLVSSGGGANISSLNQTALSALPVYLPDKIEQSRIVAGIEAIQAEAARLVDVHQRKLAAFAELKQSLLQEAFEGELTAQPDNELQEAVA